MRRLLIAAVVFCNALLCRGALAHFLWIDWQPVREGASVARLIFSDKPHSDGRDFTEKVKHAKVWRRGGRGGVADVAFARGAGADAETLVAKLGTHDGDCLEAAYDYGVYARGGQSIFLHYYAKALPADWRRRGESFARSERLELDIVPSFAAGALSVQVLFRGKPAAGQEVVAYTPGGEPCELKTDASGAATLDRAATGRYFVRAGYVEAGRGGQLDGKAYSQTGYYCTASFPIGTEAAPDNPSAAELLRAARATRSVWTNSFPGFTADVVATINGESASGKLKIDASGTVELTMPDGKPADWARDQFESMVQHRMPEGQVTEGQVEFAEHDAGSPLGRRIVLRDDRQSSYRIKDNVIREVCRSAGDMRFTISVLDVDWNAEKKYLPRSFVMNYFDSKSGALRESHAFQNEWRHFAGCDLPTRILEIAVEGKTTRTLQVELSNFELLRK